jgi:hypothetical protein
MHWLDPDYLPETSGTVDLFLINPHGDIDGMMLRDGTEVHFPPHLSGAIARQVKIGEPVKIYGVRPRGADVIAGVALDPAKGKRIIDNGPPDEHQRGKHGHKSHAEKHDAKIEGLVRNVLHGPKGETRGVLLRDDTIVRFPKHAAEEISQLLKKGKPVAVTGKSLQTDHGTVVDASAIGASMKTLRQIEKPHKHHKPHHHDDADPADAIKVARKAGYTVKGEPRRKPKHFEVDATRGGKRYELHITLDGDIRKEKPAHS